MRSSPATCAAGRRGRHRAPAPWHRSSRRAFDNCPCFAASSTARLRSDSACAPNVAAFDLRVCAARRTSASSPWSSPARAAAISAGASVENPSISSATNSASPTPLGEPRQHVAIDRSVSIRTVRRLIRPARRPLDRRDQLLHPDRLREVVVHAGLEAALAVAAHRLGRHRDDPRPLALGPPLA